MADASLPREIYRMLQRPVYAPPGVRRNSMLTWTLSPSQPLGRAGMGLASYTARITERSRAALPLGVATATLWMVPLRRIVKVTVVVWAASEVATGRRHTDCSFVSMASWYHA